MTTIPAESLTARDVLARAIEAAELCGLAPSASALKLLHGVREVDDLLGEFHNDCSETFDAVGLVATDSAVRGLGVRADLTGSGHSSSSPIGEGAAHGGYRHAWALVTATVLLGYVACRAVRRRRFSTLPTVALDGALSVGLARSRGREAVLAAHRHVAPTVPGGRPGSLTPPGEPGRLLTFRGRP